MAGPWERYRQPEAAGPWAKYAAKGTPTSALGFANREIGEAFDLPGPVDVFRGVTGYDPLNEPARQAVDDSSPQNAMRRAGIAVAPEGERPDTLVESVGEGVGTAIGALPWFTTGGQLVSGLNTTFGALPKAAQAVSQSLMRNPVAASTAEGVMGGVMGGTGYAGEKLAEAPGGMAPATGRALGEATGIAAPFAAGYTPMGYAARKAAGALAPWMQESSFGRASNRMRKLSGDPNADAARVGRSEIGLTPAQQTGNPALIGLERKLMSEEPRLFDDYVERLAENTRRMEEAARSPGQGRSPRSTADFFAARERDVRKSLDELVAAAESRASERVRRLEPRMGGERASEVVREEVEGALKAAQAEERRLWGQVPEDVLVPTGNAKAVLEKEMRRRVGSRNIPEVARDFLGEGNMAFRDQEPVRDMQDLRSQLLQEARNARAGDTPNRDRARIADELAEAIRLDMETADVGKMTYADAEDAFRSQQEVDRFFSEHDRLSKEVAGFGKRPVTRQIIQKGGIDPSSPVAQDLRASGITAQTMPGLFRRGGLKDVDNLQIEGERGVGVEGGYSRRQDIIDALVGEAKAPRLTPEQEEVARALGAMERQVPEYEQLRADMGARVEAPFPGDFDPEVSAPLKAARAFSRELNNTFRKGKIGSALGFSRTGAPAVAPGETLKKTVGQSGVSGAIAVDELRHAVQGAPNREAAEAAMRDFVQERFQLAAVGPDGTLDPKKAETFIRKNQPLFERFPQMRAGVARAISEAQGAQDARRTVDEGLKEAEQTPQGQFFRAKENREFEQAILGAQRPGEAARQAMRAAEADDSGEAVLGLKSAAVDHLLGQGLNPKQMRARFEDRNTRAALDAILTPEEVGRHRRLIEELEKAHKAGIDPGAVMDDPPSNMMDLAARVIGAQSGSNIAQSTGGGAGPGLLLSHWGSKRMVKLARKLTQGEARELLKKAMLPGNEDLYRALLLNQRDPRQADAAGRIISGYLGAGIATATDDDEPAVPYDAVRPMSPGRVAVPPGFDLSDAGRLGRSARLAGGNAHMLAGMLGYPGVR